MSVRKVNKSGADVAGFVCSAIRGTKQVTDVYRTVKTVAKAVKTIAEVAAPL